MSLNPFCTKTAEAIENSLDGILEKVGLARKDFKFKIYEKDKHGRKWVNAYVMGHRFKMESVCFVGTIHSEENKKSMIAHALLLLSNIGEISFDLPEVADD